MAEIGAWGNREMAVDMREAYLDLLEKAIIGLIYKDHPLNPDRVKKKTGWKHVARLLLGRNKRKPKNYDHKLRLVGKDWPAYAHSMIGQARMQNLRTVCEDVLRTNVPGDFIETGIWRGGACIYARAIFNAYGAENRIVWCADSFEGLPPPDEKSYPADKDDRHYCYKDLAISLEEVRDNFKSYDLLGENVKFLKGWFKDTLPAAPINKLSILRLDGDMYESTMDGLKLYDKLSIGGYVIVDDHNVIPACAKAISDFREARGITDTIIEIDGTGVYWKKTK
jgi:O-methyltransferase